MPLPQPGWPLSLPPPACCAWGQPQGVPIPTPEPPILRLGVLPRRAKVTRAQVSGKERDLPRAKAKGHPDAQTGGGGLCAGGVLLWTPAQELGCCSGFAGGVTRTAFPTAAALQRPKHPIENQLNPVSSSPAGSCVRQNLISRRDRQAPYLPTTGKWATPSQRRL